MKKSPRSGRRTAQALAAAAALGPWAVMPASAAVCNWIPASGNWAAVANWLNCGAGNGNPAGAPGAADTASIGAAGIVTVNSAQAINTLNHAGSLTVDASSLRVTGGINGAGTTTIQGGGLLNLENTLTVGGNASVVFGTGANNRVGIDGGNKVITFAAGTTVRGLSGSIGLGQLVNGSGNSVLNLGLISSDSGGTITLTQAGLTNQAVAEATGASSVLLLQSNVNNTGGTLRASAGGVVRQDAVTVTGGSISNSGGGSYQFSNSGSNVLSGVTLTSGSFMDLASAQSVTRVRSGMSLNGTVNIASNSLMNFEGDQILGGSGSIVFGAAGNNRVGIDGGSKTLTLASGITIRGDTGSIGLGQLVNGSGNALVNNGTIAADVSGGVITLQGLDGGITNNGTIRAANGGTVALQSNLAGGVGSQLAADAGSVISQQGVTISGVVNTSGSGSLRPTNSGSNFLSNVSLTGVLDMASALATERVLNNLVVNGTINVDNGSRLNMEGNQTLSGSGAVVFGSAANNRVGIDGGSKTLTVASGMTLRGQNGTIGQGQLVNGSGNALINNGTLSADVAGGVITIAGLDGGVTNNGIVQALNGGTLQLQSNLIGSPSGQLVAGPGSVISQQGVTISGVINTSGGGSLRPTNSGANFLSGVTLNGSLDMASAQATERVVNSLVLNGNIALNNGSRLNMEGTQTLSGSGAIVFGAAANNVFGVDGGNKTLTLASGVTLRGQNGSIGLGQLVNGTGNVLVNQGLISSDSGGTIVLAQSNIVNQSFAEAVGAGSVLRLDTSVDNSAGTLRSTSGGVVLQNGVSVTGGSISNSSGGTYRLSNSGGNFLSGVTLASNSSIDMASALATGRVVNGLAVQLLSTLNLDNGSLLNFEGTQNLSGTGAIVFGAGANNRVGVDGGNKTLTLTGGVTIRGTNGTVGPGQLVNGSGNGIVNNGFITSEGGGTIAIQGLEAGLVNNGRLWAQNGNLNVATALSGTGALQVDSSGVMNLANGAKVQNTLNMGAAGAALNLGTGNLTLNSNYTNVGAGAGNSFNRRAGVVGGGLIVAGGDAAQVISGTAVTGGATSNATLTIGNVRVNASNNFTNNFSYVIGASGSTGPMLRGAVQTTVNGANLSDSRLSGTGVTADNYNAGAPTGSGETRTVSFTAASAGPLAPLVGQVLNLRSTYENIADQKLNIVLGAGAAAYNPAFHVTTPAPVSLANQRVGGTLMQDLTTTNAAPAGSFSEALNARFAPSVGQAINNGGTVINLIAGGSNVGAMKVGVDTTSAGAKTGQARLTFESDGTGPNGNSGLAPVSAGIHNFTVSGNVFQAASGSLQTAALNFGTLQVGQSVNQTLVVRNTASGAAGFVEDLQASFGASGNSQITGSGGFSGILAGSNSTGANGAMTVTVLGGTAGILNSAIAVNYTSAGAVAGVSNGLGSLAVGSENFGVSGTISTTASIINQASPLLNTPSIHLGAVRVGAPSPSGAVSVSNLATAAPQAALNAAIAPTSGPITASGGFNLLLPGATNNSSLAVGLNTGTAGNFTGANAGKATVSLVSDANNVGNCAPNCQLNLGSQLVNVEGKVYAPAVGQVATPGLNFGVVRVGDTVTAKNIVINNTAAVAGLNDSLRATLGGVGGPFTGAGSVAGIAAQGSGLIAVGLNTSAAGVFNPSGSVVLSSQNPDMADVSAGANGSVALQAQINNLANADFDKLGGLGTLSQTGNNYLLDLGDVTLGQSISALLQLDNEVSGPADVLGGTFSLAGADDFSYAGWNPVTGLAAGQATGSLSINWLAAGALGVYNDTIVFSGRGTNASDTVGLAQTRQLTIRANLVGVAPPPPPPPPPPPTGVPEPGTLPLLLAAAAAGWALRRRRLSASTPTPMPAPLP